MKFCPHCGNQISDNATFCDKCGTPVNSNRQQGVVNPNNSNNHKNLILTLVVIALIVVIGAGVYLFTSGATNQVSNKQPTNNTSKAKDQATSSKEQTTKKSSSDDKAIWNSSKNSKLNTFMSVWGSNMHQDYDYFNPDNQDNFMGYRFPAVFSRNNIRVNGVPVTVGWSDDGSGSNDYNVVAIYSDLDSDRHKGNTAGAHLYLFTIHDGQPVALITQQNQGNPENAIYFKPTANQDVSSQFANIVNNDQMTY